MSTNGSKRGEHQPGAGPLSISLVRQSGSMRLTQTHTQKCNSQEMRGGVGIHVEMYIGEERTVNRCL